MQMSPLLLRTSLRYLLRHPWQIGLSVLGVALGVAVVIAIDLANGSAQRAFTLSTETITGRATHQIVASTGQLDETVYRQLLIDERVSPLAPAVLGYVTVTGDRARPLQIFGIDPFAEPPFRSFTGAILGGANNASFAPLFTTPGSILLGAETAAGLGVQKGDQLRVEHNGLPIDLTIIDILSSEQGVNQRALDGLILTDIATAQETLGMIGKLSSIDLLATPAEAERISQRLPPNAKLTTPTARTSTISQLTSAFELNLTALSLLALVVGMFLIYNTMTFSVVQRRSMFGTLRCLGVNRRQIFNLVLLEALIVGLLGSGLGVGLGILLGRGLVNLVTQTINDLYFVVTVRSLFIAPMTLVKGLLLGLGATLIAAAVPAFEATSTPPRTVLRRSSIEDRIRKAVPLVSAGGLGLLMLGGLLLLLPGRSLVVAFGALFVLVVGAALLTPLLTVALMALLRPLGGWLFGLLGRMAARDVVAALSRTSVAIAALMVAVSVTVGVGIMVGSFRQTVVTWLEGSLQADIYISPPGLASNRVDASVKDTAVALIASTPGVAEISSYSSLKSDSEFGEVQLLGLNLQQGFNAYRFLEGNPDQIWQAWQAGALIVSEPFAYRHQLPLTGGSVVLNTPQGSHRFPIAGVFYDYTSEQGGIGMHGATFRQWYGDHPPSSIALYVAPDVDPDALVETLRQRVSSEQTLFIRSNRGLRQETLTIFDRTFAITSVLQLLATVIAFVGILSALMALQLERARELGVLRANGLTPRQVWAVVLGQTGLMGLTAGLLALPVGLTVAAVLVFVINKRSFGWTLDLIITPGIFIQAMLLALVAALLAGIYPAIRMSKTAPAMALREE